MTIRDAAVGVLNALARQAISTARRPPGARHQPPGASGQLELSLAAAVADPMVGRSRIEHLLARLVEQTNGGQGGTATVARLAVATVLEVEGPRAAGELLIRWRAARANAGPSDAGCPGCIAELEVRVLTELGRYAEAAAVLDVRPDEGWHAAAGCPEPDAALRCAVLLALLGAGQELRAMAYHCAGLRQVAHDRTRLHLLADHVDFLRLTGNGPAAVELARTHVSLLRAGCTAAQRLRWCTAAAHVVAEQVDAGHGEDLVTVAWPEQPTEPMSLAEFGMALQARATPLATAFDVRNGNRRHVLALADRGRHDGARAALPVNRAVAGEHRPRRRPGRRAVTLQDVLACADPYAEAEEAVLSCTLVDPVGVWEALVSRAAVGASPRDAGREAAARAVLARVLCLAGQRSRCLIEAATAEAMSAAAGDRVAVAGARATAAACLAGTEPGRGLQLAQLVIDELGELPPGVECGAALCRARSAGVAALLTLDRLDEAERWMAQLHHVHPGQQVRMASQRALVLRRRGRLPEAVAVLREGGRIADAHGLTALGVGIRLDLAEALEALGDIDGAVGALTRTLLDLPHVPEPDPLAIPRTRMDLARILAEADRLVSARVELDRARRELMGAPDTIQDLATVDYLLGTVLAGLGERPAALTHFGAAAVEFTLAQRPDGVALAERNRGAVLFLLERSAEAAVAFDTAAEASRAAEDDWHALACRIDAAQVRGREGAASGAVEELGRLREALPGAAAADAVGQAELAYQLARVDHALAHCALAGEDVATAAELAERALAGYRAAGADHAVAALSVDAGLWWWQAGDTGSALRYLRGAQRSARALGDGSLITRCNAALDRMGALTSQGDSGRGGTTLPRH
ncbi:MAG: hypothetical protein ABR608_15060 [Pseudonocardiaceae bacterium]